ncbi:MAG: CoA transferase [Alphaproteobacteria bacterium]|nr:CoA transferase [Alphaproteobacteria bacterium]
MIVQDVRRAPLEGLRVLELASILAGPWAGQLLADLGADVIKVEAPGRGDETRRWGPPFMEGSDGQPLEAAYFHACNRGKRSIEIDLAAPDGQSRVRELASDADVLIENFRVGRLAGFGLDYAALGALNSRLIYCSITGYGQDGPYSERPGYDFVIQGLSGIMDLTGEADGPPQKTGVAFSDIFTGIYAVVAIQAALIDRSRTGRGTHIDMALLDSMVGVLANQASNLFVSGTAPHRMGNAHPNIVPYQVFPARDGRVVIAAGNDRQFAGLCEVLGLRNIAKSDAYANNAARVANRAALVAELGAATRRCDASDLIERLSDAGVPAGPVNTLDQVFADPQVIHRKIKVSLADTDTKAGSTAGLRPPFLLDGSSVHSTRPPPRLGGDNRDILGSGDATWPDPPGRD